MHITIPSAALLGALQAMSQVVTEGTIPALANVRLDADYRRLTVTATDLDASIVRHIPRESLGTELTPGSITVPHDVLAKILKKLDPEDEVSITTRGAVEGTCTISAGALILTLPTIDPAEYPPIPEVQEQHEVTFVGAEFRRALSLCAFCMSTDNTRHILQAVAIRLRRARTEVIGCDGRRLSRVTFHQPNYFVDLPASSSGAEAAAGEGEDEEAPKVTVVDLIVPAATVTILDRLIPVPKDSDAAGLLPDIIFSIPAFNLVNPPKYLRVKIGETEIVTKLVEGNYPNVDLVIPSTQTIDTTTNVGTAPFLAALERAVVLGGDQIALSFDWRELTMEVRRKDNAHLVDKVPISGSTGRIDGRKISFNPTYLLELAKATAAVQGTSINVVFHIGELQPMRFRIEGDDVWDHILMPMRTAGAGAAAEEPEPAAAEQQQEAPAPAEADQAAQAATVPAGA